MIKPLSNSCFAPDSRVSALIRGKLSCRCDSKEMTNTNQVGDQLRLDLLREALPYIQRFQGQTFVVKLSGKATEDHENLSSLAEELALLHQVGIRICVIHGGGKQLSELASRMGIEQTDHRRPARHRTMPRWKWRRWFSPGRSTLTFSSALRNRGIEAVGLSGVDGNIVHAERRPPKEILNRETGERSQVDFGHVGDVVEDQCPTTDGVARSGLSARHLFAGRRR